MIDLTSVRQPRIGLLTALRECAMVDANAQNGTNHRRMRNTVLDHASLSVSRLETAGGLIGAFHPCMPSCDSKRARAACSRPELGGSRMCH